MNKLIALLLVCLSILSAQAQVKPTSSPESEINEVSNDVQISNNTMAIDSNAICMNPDVMPEFPGGMFGLIRYLQQSIRIPDEANKYGLSGRVVANFVMNRHGKAVQIKILKSLSNECDAEVMRVIRHMPAWRPATKNGVPVNVKYVLPVTFN